MNGIGTVIGLVRSGAQKTAIFTKTAKRFARHRAENFKASSHLAVPEGVLEIVHRDSKIQFFINGELVREMLSSNQVSIVPHPQGYASLEYGSWFINGQTAVRPNLPWAIDSSPDGLILRTVPDKTGFSELLPGWRKTSIPWPVCQFSWLSRRCDCP